MKVLDACKSEKEETMSMELLPTLQIFPRDSLHMGTSKILLHY